MALRALSPLEEPTARYVPHSPTDGLTAVGIRKDMGLFPGSRLLCWRKEVQTIRTQRIKGVLIIYVNKKIRRHIYWVCGVVLCFIRPGEVQDLAVQKDS